MDYHSDLKKLRDLVLKTLIDRVENGDYIIKDGEVTSRLPIDLKSLSVVIQFLKEFKPEEIPTSFEFDPIITAHQKKHKKLQTNII